MNRDTYRTVTKISGMAVYIGIMVGLLIIPVAAQNTQSGEKKVAYAAETSLFHNIKVNQDDTAPAVLNKIISLRLKRVTLTDALQEIANRAGLKLSYSTYLVPQDKKLTLDLKQVTISEALWKVLDGTSLRYAVSANGHLVLMKRYEMKSPTVQEILQETVRGQVIDASTGDPLPGVNIVLKGTTTGTSTDDNGNYSLELEELEGILIFSFIGFETQEVQITGRTEIDVALQPRAFEADEIVVSGYQIQERASVSGAISVVDEEVLNNQTVSNPIKSLQGRVAGLFINTSGDPAGDTEVRIRGVSTLNNNNPLYVIDGIPTDEKAFNILNPNDIENVQVLKDAASSAIYGSRASNGVILVTTKKAEKNSFSVKYNSQLTVSDFHTVPDVLNTENRAVVQFRASVNDGIDPENIPDIDYDYTQNPDGSFTLNSVIIPETIGGQRTGDTDWFDEISRTGVIQDHNLSISTGGENSGVNVSFRYFKDKYVLLEREVEKYQTRVNSFQNFANDKITVGQNLTITKSDDNGYDNDIVMFNALNIRPTIPVRTEDGGFAGPPNGNFSNSSSDNPVRALVQNRWDKVSDINLFGNVYARATITENLDLNANFGLDWENSRLRNIEPRFQTGFLQRQTNILENGKSDDFSYNFSATANYQRDINKHSVGILGGSEITKNTFQRNLTRRENFAVQELDFFVENAGSGNQFVEGSATGFSLASFFGKLDYDYDDTYIASITVRHDGSSKFAPSNRFGTFSSFTLAWRMTQNKFFEDLLPIFSEFKLRAGVGETGNQRINNEARFSLFDVAASSPERVLAPWVRNTDYANYVTTYDISGNDSGSLPSGFRRTQLANDELKWETTSEINVGLDFGLEGDKVFGSVEVFNRDTKDILIQPDFIAVLGEGGNRFVNGASVNVKGFEMSTTYRDNVGNLNFNVSGTFGYYKDEITELPDNVVDSFQGNTEKTILGQSINSLFGFVTDGLFQSQEEVDAHAEQPGAAPGRIKYVDLNGDGRITNLDQKFFGSSTPQIEYGIGINARFKGFDFNMFWQGVGSVDVLETDRARTDFASLWAGTNYGERILDAWTPENRDTDIPKVTLQDNNDEGRISTYFLANGSYLKLRQATLGYTFQDLPVAQDIRVYVTGENLLTLKSNSFVGPDPERPGTAYPRPRNISLGVNISF